MNQVNGTTNNIFVEIWLFKVFVKGGLFLLHFLQVVENLCYWILPSLFTHEYYMKLHNNVACLLRDHIPECLVSLKKCARPYFCSRLYSQINKRPAVRSGLQD